MIHVFSDVATLTTAAAKRFRQAFDQAIAEHGRFSCALTGGSAAKAVYPRIAEDKLRWEQIHLFFGDERAVPPDHPDSNYALAKATLLDGIRISSKNVHRMRGEAADLAAAADDYEAELQRVLGATPVLDLVHLGMGPDGHVCSLFPGHRLLEETRRSCAPVTDSPKPPPRRLTLTMPVLHAARSLCFIVMGEDKAAAVREVLENPRSQLPAALAARGSADVTWLLDGKAASALTQTL